MKDIKFARFLVLVNGAVPLALLSLDAVRGHLGANPVNFSIRTTGLMSLIFLLLSLATTPAGRLTGWNWLTQLRRTLGLYAFFYAVLHFSLFFVFDRALSLRSTVTEMLLRPYLTVGAAGLLAMVPLAMTSTNGMIRRIGATRWKKLHRLAYFAAIAGALHYFLLVKADVRQPVAFAIVLALLLGYRLIAQAMKLRAGVHPHKPKFWSGKLRVARIVVETPDVRTFRLVATEGTDLPFDFLPGQFLNLLLLIEGAKVNRSYTIASSPTHCDYCEITVKRDANGTASRFLHDSVQEGDLLDVSAPAGRFTFTGVESDSVVLIAGGVGITPLMSKVRYLTDCDWRGEIFLVFGVRTESDIIFREELEDLSRRHSNLHVTVTLSRVDGVTWNGERGRVTAELLQRVVPNLTQRQIHYCGPADMNQSLQQMFWEMQIPEAQVRSESFLRPRSGAAESQSLTDAAVSAVATEREPIVSFARSGRSASVATGRTVLEMAESVGVSIDFDCRAGTCGTCKTKLLSGRVRHDTDDVLTTADRANGLILCCQAHCLEDVVIDA